MAFYSYTRSMNPATGDVQLSGGTWAGGAPVAETVLRVLRTRKGSCLADPSFGLDYSVVQKALPGSAAALRAAIFAALDFLVKRNRIQNLAVTVSASGSSLQYDVSFTDPRMATRDRVTGTL